MSKTKTIELVIQRFNRDIAPVMEKILGGVITVKPSDDQTVKNLEEAMNWMTDFIDCEIREYQYVRTLLPESTWANYEMLDLTDTVEWKMLKTAKKVVMEKWKKRPSAIKRTY